MTKEMSMSSEVPKLDLRAIVSETFGTIATPPTYYEQKLFRAIEQAVRAQWAAEVDRLKGEGVADLLDEAANELISARTERDSAQAEAKRLREALEAIVEWRFPSTGRYWEDDPTRPMSYAACYGSNGERDYMRAIARAALQPGTVTHWMPLPASPAAEMKKD